MGGSGSTLNPSPPRNKQVPSISIPWISSSPSPSCLLQAVGTFCCALFLDGGGDGTKTTKGMEAQAYVYLYTHTKIISWCIFSAVQAHTHIQHPLPLQVCLYCHNLWDEMRSTASLSYIHPLPVIYQTSAAFHNQTPQCQWGWGCHFNWNTTPHHFTPLLFLTLPLLSLCTH